MFREPHHCLLPGLIELPDHHLCCEEDHAEEDLSVELVERGQSGYLAFTFHLWSLSVKLVERSHSRYLAFLLHL